MIINPKLIKLKMIINPKLIKLKMKINADTAFLEFQKQLFLLKKQ